MATGHEVVKESTPARVTAVRRRAARNLEPRTVVRCTYVEGEVQFQPSSQLVYFGNSIKKS